MRLAMTERLDSVEAGESSPSQYQPITNVGVFMTVYGGDQPAAFERALLSMLRQRVAPTTVIRVYLGVDGPISADLEAVIAKHKDSLYRVVRAPVNAGLARMLNRLIEARADESYYFRMDADDFSMPTRVQSQMSFLVQRPHVDIVGTDIIEVDPDGGRRIVAFLADPSRLKQFICFRPPVAHPTVCFRSRVFDIVPRYPMERGNEDIALWFECAARGLQFDNVHEPLLEFTVSKDFWQRRGFDKSWGEFRTYSRGILRLWGPHWRLLFPVIRLMVRLSPRRVSQFVYRLRARSDP